MRFRRLLFVLVLGLTVSLTAASVASAITIRPMCYPSDDLPCGTGW